MIRSRLRRPTSKSMTAVLWPRSARPDEKLALVVVLPTPPLPEVTTTIFAMRVQSLELERGHHEDAVDQPHLGGLAGDVLGQRRLGGAVDARDGDEFGFEAGGEDARLGVAARAGDGLAAQRAVDVHVAVGQHLGAGVDGGVHDEVAALRVGLLAGAQRLVDDQRRHLHRHLTHDLADHLALDLDGAAWAAARAPARRAGPPPARRPSAARYRPSPSRGACGGRATRP